jgi:lysozyme
MRRRFITGARAAPLGALALLTGLSCTQGGGSTPPPPAAPSNPACTAVSGRPGQVPIHDFAAPQVELGIDLSHYDGVVSWPEVERASVTFVYLKATEGEHFVDPCFLANRDGVRGTRLRWGAYHVMNDKASPAAQAEHFLRAVGETQGGLPHALDVEGNRIGDRGISGKEVLALLQAIEAKTGQRPVLYTGHRGLATLSQDAPELKGYKIWVPEYEPEPPPTPEGLKSWWMWQRSPNVRVPGIATPVDLSITPVP